MKIRLHNSYSYIKYSKNKDYIICYINNILFYQFKTNIIDTFILTSGNFERLSKFRKCEVILFKFLRNCGLSKSLLNKNDYY